MATAEHRTAPAPTDAISYSDLYARWERGNWSATEIDFTQDRIDWHEKLTAEQRRSALWLYALFFHGEDSVTDNLSPYLDAAPREEQTYFLATQQADEARHAVFFHRFMHEVVGLGGETVASTLAATRSELTWGHRAVFSRLDAMAVALRADPSPLQLTKAITLYHIIVEASLAQPGQHMIEDYLERYDVLPGFRTGMRNVATDEQRHIAFGVKLLADLYSEHGEPVSDAIAEVLRDTLPLTTAVAAPPNWDRSYTECFGFSLEDLGEEGARSLEQKIRAIGIAPQSLRTGMAWEQSPRERAIRGRRLLKGNLIGSGGPVDRDPELLALLFDGMRRSANPATMPDGTTLQWDFTDHDPWQLVLEGGSARAVPGHAVAPDLTIRASVADWLDIAGGRRAPLKLTLRRRLRVTGDLRLLPGLTKLFA